MFLGFFRYLLELPAVVKERIKTKSKTAKGPHFLQLLNIFGDGNQQGVETLPDGYPTPPPEKERTLIIVEAEGSHNPHREDRLHYFYPFSPGSEPFSKRPHYFGFHTVGIYDHSSGKKGQQEGAGPSWGHRPGNGS